jgi:acyl carrier protein
MKTSSERIEFIFKKVFGSQSIFELKRSISPEWDSLKHIELILELEDEFLIELTSDQGHEIVDFNSCLSTISESM